MGKKILHYHLLVNKDLINVYIIKLIKHKNDRPNGIAKTNAGIIISLLFSLLQQLIILS